MTFRIFVLISFLYPFFARAQHWENVGNRIPNATVVDLFLDSSNHQLFISGGILQTADSLILKGIALYQNGDVFNLGTGFLGNPITNSAGKINGQLYAGGWADPAIERSLAKFNPLTETWTPLINAPWGNIRGFKKIDTLMHFYGSFDYPDSVGNTSNVGIIVNDTCYYSPWVQPFTQSLTSTVMDIEKFQNKLFCGGSFTVNGNKRVFCYFDSTGVYQVGQWNSSNDQVACLEIWQNKLILGGYFPGNPASNDISLLTYDGNSLYPLLPNNPFLIISALKSHENLLFISGYLIDSAVYDVQVFDGNTLTSLTLYQLNNGIRDMEIMDDTLFIAGFFQNCFPPENISGVAKYSVPVSQLTGYKKTDKETEIDISLYPNPIESWFSINNASQITAIEINNILGQSIYQNENFQAQNNERIPFPETGKGMYVVRIRNANGLWNSIKVIKK